MDQKHRKKSRCPAGWILVLGLLIASLALGGSLVYAKAEMLVMGWAQKDGKLKIYVRNVDSKDEAREIRIGENQAKITDSYDIIDDHEAVRTLILMEASKKVMPADQAKMKSLAAAIIDGHMDGEEFQVAKFSEKLSYLEDDFSSEYTDIKDDVNDVSFKGKGKGGNLYKLIAKAVDKLDEGYGGYSRMIVISTGVKTKKKDRDKLYDDLEETGFPVYTVGCKLEKGNEKKLENLYDISRTTEAEHFNLSDSEDLSSILLTLKEDYAMSVYEAKLPGNVGGDIMEAVLTFDEGDALAFSLPYQEGESKGSVPVVPIAIGGIAVLLLVIVAVAVSAKKKREAEEDYEPLDLSPQPGPMQQPAGPGPMQPAGLTMQQPMGPGPMQQQPMGPGPMQPQQAPQPDPYSLDSLTVAYQDNAVFNGAAGGGSPFGGSPGGPGAEITEALFTEPLSSGHYLRLVDQDTGVTAADRGFADKVFLGRSSECDVVLDDPSISAKHCRISWENGKFYVKDLNSTNKTMIGQIQVAPNTKRPIHPGDTLVLGGKRYQVQIG